MEKLAGGGVKLMNFDNLKLEGTSNENLLMATRKIDGKISTTGYISPYFGERITFQAIDPDGQKFEAQFKVKMQGSPLSVKLEPESKKGGPELLDKLARSLEKAFNEDQSSLEWLRKWIDVFEHQKHH